MLSYSNSTWNTRAPSFLFFGNLLTLQVLFMYVEYILQIFLKRLETLINKFLCLISNQQFLPQYNKGYNAKPKSGCQWTPTRQYSPLSPPPPYLGPARGPAVPSRPVDPTHQCTATLACYLNRASHLMPRGILCSYSSWKGKELPEKGAGLLNM